MTSALLPVAAPVLAPVVQLHPDGVVIRTDDDGHHWVTVRREGRCGSEQRLTHAELGDFYTRAGVVLGRTR